MGGNPRHCYSWSRREVTIRLATHDFERLLKAGSKGREKMSTEINQPRKADLFRTRSLTLMRYAKLLTASSSLS